MTIPGCLLGLLIVADGQARQNKFSEAQITELLCGYGVAVKRLALCSSYGKTEVQHLETPVVCGLETCKT